MKDYIEFFAGAAGLLFFAFVVYWLFLAHGTTTLPSERPFVQALFVGSLLGGIAAFATAVKKYCESRPIA